MSSKTNHRKRSHRSERQHRVCLHSMKQYAPVGTHLDYGDGFLTTTGRVMSKHALGRKKPVVSRKAIGTP